MKNQLQTLIREHLAYPESASLQQRGIADRIEDACNQIIRKNFSDVRPARSRRSIEDVSIGDVYVDHKTSDRALDFKMPNLISIDRLQKLDRELLYNFVIYDSSTQEINDVMVLTVYELNWDHLAIQNLGAGQLQISNMAAFLDNPRSDLTPVRWMERLRTEAIGFYQRLARKTQQRQEKWEKWQVSAH